MESAPEINLATNKQRHMNCELKIIDLDGLDNSKPIFCQLTLSTQFISGT